MPDAALDHDPARPSAIEDPSNHWLVHPLSAALLGPAMRARLHPNLVSLAGLGCGAAAAVAYADWRTPVAVLAGFAAMAAWHVLDGLDGKLARATGRATPLGRILDGTCDYLVFTMVEMALVFSFVDWPPMLALCLTAAGAHVVQAAAYEGERVAWLRRAAGGFTAPRRARRVAWLTAGHEALEHALGNRARPVDALLTAHPGSVGRYLAASAPRLRTMALLGANARTLAIALACLAGHPAWFWWWEIAGLSVILLVVARRLRRVEAGLGTPADGC